MARVAVVGRLVAPIVFLVAGFISPSGAAVFAPAVEFGSHTDDGVLYPGSHASGEYLPYYRYRSFFAFDLSGISGTVTGAKLHVKFSSYQGGATETVALHEVTTPVAELASGSPAVPQVFNDLGDGVFLGSQEVHPQVFSYVTYAIELEPAGVPLVQSALGAEFAVGLSVSSLDGGGPEFVGGCCLTLTRMLEIEGALEVAPPAAPEYFAPDYAWIDFEFGTSQLPNDIPGVSFPRTSQSGPDPWFSGTATGGGHMFGGQAYGNLYSGDYSDLAIDFDPPVQAVGGWVRNSPTLSGNQNVPQLRIRIRDASGALLEERMVDLPAADAPPAFEAFSAAGGVARIEWSPLNVGPFMVDDVVYGALQPQVVPVASGSARAALCALLLGGVVVSRRRGGARRMGRTLEHSRTAVSAASFFAMGSFSARSQNALLDHRPRLSKLG